MGSRGKHGVGQTSLYDADKVSKMQQNGATVRQLDFTPMDAFMSHVLEAFRTDAYRAVRVFPATSRVILFFCDRVANDVVRSPRLSSSPRRPLQIGEYIQPLLSQARVASQNLFLQATAASFVQAWKLVDLVMEILGEEQKMISRTRVEDVMYDPSSLDRIGEN